MTTTANPEVQPGTSNAWSGWMKRYGLFMLFVTAIISTVDRQLVTVLQESIKTELGASDTEMGLLTGFYFTLFYIAAGVPLARIADTGNRKMLIGWCIAAWSAATALCGLAQSYIHLAISRLFVAAGEAGSSPATTSILSDVFPISMRTLVLSVASAGSAVGIAAGIYIGGTLHEEMGWRTVFMAVGLPGVVFALLFMLTVPEPPRTPSSGGASKATALASLGSFWKIPTYRALAIIAVFGSITGFGVLNWMPTFLIRVHDMSTGDIGVQLGMATVLGLFFGNLSGGAFADFLARKGMPLIWASGIGLAICVPIGLWSAFAPDSTTSIVAFGFFMFFLGFWPPPVTAAVISIVDVRTRALAAATVPFFISIGGGIGPFFIGAMNDVFAATHGQLAIRLSIAAVVAASALGSVACFVAGRSLAKDHRNE